MLRASEDETATRRSPVTTSDARAAKRLYGGRPAAVAGDDGAELGEGRAPGARGQQGGEQGRSVLPRHDPPVAQHDDAAVRRRADEPPDALPQPERRLRQLVLAEGVLVPLRASLDERVVGHLEREARHDDALEQIAREVHALPEGTRAEEHAATGAEALEERAARAVDTLREDGDAR